MKHLYVLSLLLALVSANSETYSTENDNFDIDSAVANLDSLNALVGCLLNTNPCDDVIADFKKDIPEAVKTACVKCTDAQKHLFNVFLRALNTKLPKKYEEFKVYFDSEGKYFGSLEKAVADF